MATVVFKPKNSNSGCGWFILLGILLLLWGLYDLMFFLR
jgi:hypothetical protein